MKKITLLAMILISINVLGTIIPPCTPPLITVNPTSNSVCSGIAQVSFSVLVAFDAALTYQWQVNQGSGFINLNSSPAYMGVTQSTLNITGITTALNGYQYRCIVSIDTCTSISNAATLTVTNCTNCTPPVIALSPNPISVCEGSMASFSVTANAPTPSYQWQVNQGAGFANLSNMPPYSGVTMPILNITGVTAIMNGYQFRCIVSSDTCRSTSNAATLTVNAPPIVTANSATIVSGQTAILTATGATSYVWHIGGMMGDTTNPISLSPTSTTTYTVTGTSNGCSKTTTATVTVTIQGVTGATCSAPAITTGPTPVSTCTGMNAMFSVMASGTNLTYQWQVNQGAGFANISGFPPYAITTTGLLTITSVPPAFTSYQYRCVVSSDTCRSTSNAATLTVNAPPIVTANSATIVSGQTAILTATGATSYVWHIGGMMGDTTNPISLSPTSTTTYTVTGTSNGCSKTTTATVTVTIQGVTGATGTTGLTGATGAVGNRR